jgi:phosphoribosylformylglycinamidine synthase
MYRAVVTVTLRPSILDPQGKAVQQALHALGHTAVAAVRAGKHVELLVEAETAAEAERVAREAAGQLLANPVMEDFSVAVEPLAARTAAG